MTRRRAISVYVAAVAIPAFTLLFFGVQSYGRQRQAMSTLMRSNARLSGERLAAELENRTIQLAQGCLREAVHAGVSMPELEPLRARHPVARYLFFYQGGRVLYPPLHTPAPRGLEELLAGEPQPSRSQYADLLEKAEDQELRRLNYPAALSFYRTAGATAHSALLRALALFRSARCLGKMNLAAEAAQAYETLAATYPDLTDPAHRPYALISAVARQAGAASNAPVWRDAVRGRWPLSGDQMDYYAARLGDGSQPPADSYAAHLNFARNLEGTFRPAAAPGTDELYSVALPGSPDQIFYISAGGQGAEAVFIGLAANSDWIKGALLAQCRTQLRTPEAVSIRPKSSLAAAAEERVGFPSLFPAWALIVKIPADASGRAGLAFQAATTFLVLALLLIGLVLMVRDLSREALANQLRADFVGSVSHELKTPITLIRLYGETLLDDEDFTPPQRREFYEIITRESERLGQLVDKVLNFARIERGEKQYRLQAGDMAPVIRRTVEAYEPYLKRRGFSVEAKMDATLPLVRFDQDAVSQALVNLVDNAVKYSGEVKWIAVRAHGRTSSVVVDVEDRGIGVPHGEYDKIFQRFYRVKSAPATGGYGLGLYLVRHIMDAHGGSVEIESEPGRGSRFSLVFPSLSEES